METTDKQYGKVYIRTAFDSTFVLAVDSDNKAVVWSRFKTEKQYSQEAQNSAGNIAKTAAAQGIKSAEVCVKGPGRGYGIAIQALQNAGIEITMIKDMTLIPHNGCRPPKALRKG